jgi:hypothetical protein
VEYPSSGIVEFKKIHTPAKDFKVANNELLIISIRVLGSYAKVVPCIIQDSLEVEKE